MVPLSSDWISFMTFIASTMQTTLSGFTGEPTVTKGGLSGEGAA